MDSQHLLQEEQIQKLLPALSLLAESIGTNKLDQYSIVNFTIEIGLSNQKWAAEELDIWSKILQKAFYKPDDADGTFVVAELINRGVKEFPAILAYNAAKKKKSFGPGTDLIDIRFAFSDRPKCEESSHNRKTVDEIPSIPR